MRSRLATTASAGTWEQNSNFTVPFDTIRPVPDITLSCLSAQTIPYDDEQVADQQCRCAEDLKS
jgi:hypothetical protein